MTFQFGICWSRRKVIEEPNSYTLWFQWDDKHWATYWPWTQAVEDERMRKVREHNDRVQAKLMSLATAPDEPFTGL
jgi:hypothetical protein